MKTIKKIMSIFLVLFMVISIIPITASAEMINGRCGDDAWWYYDTTTHSLFVYGNGDMYNSCPWKNYKDSIKSVQIGDGIISIGKYTFEYCENLVTLSIGENVTRIGYRAFYGTSLRDIYYNGTEEQWNNIYIDSYNESISYHMIHFLKKHIHIYEGVVIHTTCTEKGYTTYTCACGDNYVADYVDALGHDMITDEAVAPDCENTGLTEGSHCSRCNDATVEQETVPALGHTYESVVTAPTCTEQGYTTYTCSCSDSYVSDYVDATGHNYTSEVTTPATHTATGVMTYICDCGDSYTETIDKLAEHNYESVVTAPTCTEQGYTTYTCECGDTYVDDYLNVTSHADNDNDGSCDNCDKQLCNHNCHKGGFFWKIICFFNKVFSLNRTCECGAAHY